MDIRGRNCNHPPITVAGSVLPSNVGRKVGRTSITTRSAAASCHTGIHQSPPTGTGNQHGVQEVEQNNGNGTQGM